MHLAETNDRNGQQLYKNASALILSLLLHLSIFSLIPQSPAFSSSKPIELTFLEQPPASKPSKLVVPESELPDEIPTTKTENISEKNSSTPVETLRRKPPEAPKAAQTPIATKSPTPQQSAKIEKPSSSPVNLRLNQENIERTLPGLAVSSTESQRSDRGKALDDSQRLMKFQRAAPFRRLALAPSVVGKIYDDTAYLPEIQDGDLTLLNAKADRFAVFVKRVATQVFGALRRRNWAGLSYSETKQVGKFSTVEAILSKEGKLLQIIVRDSSGSKKFDEITAAAAEDGSWDQNPPPGATMADGKIHFIYQARTWARPTADGVRESRWLLLGVGLL